MPLDASLAVQEIFTGAVDPTVPVANVNDNGDTVGAMASIVAV
jgi:hypothetical protein